MNLIKSVASKGESVIGRYHIDIDRLEEAQEYLALCAMTNHSTD